MFCKVLLILTQSEKRRYSEFSWSVFYCIRTKYGDLRKTEIFTQILRRFTYLVQMPKNTDLKNSKYGCFLLIVKYV